MIWQGKRYSVTNLDNNIIEVKINKLDEQRTEKREQGSKHDFFWFIISSAVDLANL